MTKYYYELVEMTSGKMKREREIKSKKCSA